MQAFVHHCGHHLFRVALGAGQIGPADVANKERVAGQNLLWLIRNFGINNLDADALGSVTGSFHNAQLRMTQCQLIAIANRQMWNRGSRFLAENDLRPSARRQLAVPTDKVGVQMCFDYVLNPESVGGSFVDILIDVALRIDHCCLAVRSD